MSSSGDDEDCAQIKSSNDTLYKGRQSSESGRQLSHRTPICVSFFCSRIHF
ncbi:hypothetical protein E2C01_063056 [Portunus trituberculatus]|uniref:Uncharacterized protein n=1 Tax=Portunus trituberculatus TaxID=210409 RepID=A0A5B7HFV9_PORTR|nr:hypothetical protein [Portunus trituberculatus]